MEVNISRIQEISSFTAAGVLTTHMQTTFTIGEHGPFTVLIPKSEYSAVRSTQEIEKIKREVEAAVAKI